MPNSELIQSEKIKRGDLPLKIEIVELGVMKYQEALKTQYEYHDRVLSGQGDGWILCVQHPPVITMGKNANPQSLLVSRQFMERQGIEMIETDRGGDVTAHELGQAVLYPIIPLQHFRLAPRSYVNLLEQTVIEFLGHFSVESRVDAINPGVWVKGHKICAIGVRIKTRVTLHGLALNVTNSMQTFANIVPCGLKGRGITSLNREYISSEPLNCHEVGIQLAQMLANKIVDRRLASSR